jgi:thioredoxin reductase (NADPH)
MIIGAGPAGLSAALQLRRQGQAPIVLECGQPGGLLHNAHWVENYPGFPDGISGPALVERFLTQVERFGVEIVLAQVQNLSIEGGIFQIDTDQGRFAAEIVIVASGTKAKPLPDVSISEEASRRVFSEVVPLLNERGKTILIIGAGDAALDYALNLADRNQVLILNRSRRVKGLKLLWERVQREPSIHYYDQHMVLNIQQGPDRRLEVDTFSEGKGHTYLCDYVIAAIGREPALDFLDEDLESQSDTLSERGKLYFIGDVVNNIFRQTGIAVGDGLRVAMDIEQRLLGG